MSWNFERECYTCSELRREIAALQKELQAAQLRANTAIIENRVVSLNGCDRPLQNRGILVRW
jgi:hypothetical protein